VKRRVNAILVVKITSAALAFRSDAAEEGNQVAGQRPS
jgi:hypothetical protein